MSRYTDLFDFSGRRALVTGAAAGIGAAIARALAEQGAEVLLADRDVAALHLTAGEIGTAATPHAYDQADAASIEALAAAAGPVDILVNNAGILNCDPLADLHWDDLRRVVDVNLVGLIGLMRLVGGGMVARRRGVVLNIGSQMAFTGGRHRSVYAATKAAVTQVTKSAAVEWGAAGVRVNCLAPGRTVTNINRAQLSDPAVHAAGLERIPLRRYGQPEDIANAALFLVSEASAYVTGHTLVADGGWILE